MVAAIEAIVFRGEKSDIIVIDAPHRTVEEHMSTNEQRKRAMAEVTSKIQAISQAETQKALGRRLKDYQTQLTQQMSTSHSAVHQTVLAAS